jgi:hypothetical protein
MFTADLAVAAIPFPPVTRSEKEKANPCICNKIVANAQKGNIVPKHPPGKSGD